MGIYVERNPEIVAHVNGELSQPVGSENVESHLARILVLCFDDKRLSLPFAASRRAATRLQGCNYFSFYIHFGNFL